eukprot:5014925-Karenia_brevis.AAC.1
MPVLDDAIADCRSHADLTAGHAQPVLFDGIEDTSQGLAHTLCGRLPQHKDFNAQNMAFSPRGPLPQHSHASTTP